MSETKLIALYGDVSLKLEVLSSPAGFYIGRKELTGAPYARDSQEYYVTPEIAGLALASGTFTMRTEP